MSERLNLTPLPPDVLTRSQEGNFIGAGYVYNKGENGLVVKEVKFGVNPQEVLDPFYYNKPTPNPEDPFESPLGFTRDSKPRAGYYPLAFVEQALRPLIHLYEIDDAFFAAVSVITESEPRWETRYFPKNCLDPEVWNQALKIIEQS